ncbi:MAG: EscU/YscU/HrcU family type III secretion system export apparatus switch protein [Sphingomonadales bacterium]|nr:EscU/YscU/HrcU family type III secretion system export apparatus switch protein [Sphingomonadales bacterium]
MTGSAGEKTLAPTGKRLRDAARDGDVLRSRELAAAAAILVGAGFLSAAGPWLMRGLEGAMRLGLSWNRAAIEDFDPARLLPALVLATLAPVLLLGAVVAGAVLAIQLGPGGPGRWNAGNLAPRPSRLDPVAGLSRMLGAAGWIEAAKGLVKIALLGAIAWGWARSRLAVLANLEAAELAGQLAIAWQAITSLLFALAAGLVVIAMGDYPVQWLRRRRRLRMSLQELRDEHKESDGSPQHKAAIRQRQRQLAISGVAAAMRRAQFLITNPTHFAIAMSYDPELAPAPVVLAKGRGEKALAMRELAREHGVPTLEYPELARSVYYTTRERQMIREELYAAVAGVVAFVLALKRGEAPPEPLVEVPVMLRFDADGRLDPSAKG